jgi:aminoglycoside phosphotransferase (APT) family kinase protein
MKPFDNLSATYALMYRSSSVLWPRASIRKQKTLSYSRNSQRGGFNRVFQISMRDGSQLVARIPYPTTAPKCFAVASEVATMDFLRSHGIPVPKVYAYSATSDNAAEVEYIIMEMLEGRQIGDYWYSMTEEERLKITFQIARIEGRLFSIPLPASGSIYYSHDLEPSIQRLGLPDRSCYKLEAMASRTLGSLCS